jgi:CarboxypepD_reg-like domain
MSHTPKVTIFLLIFSQQMPMTLKSRLLQFPILTLVMVLLSLVTYAQKRSATVTGRVVDENENPLAKVSVVILGKQTGTLTTDSGTFTIKVTSGKALALVFSFQGYKSEQRNFFLNEDEQERIIVKLEKGTKTLDEVVVSAPAERKEAGLIRINPKNALIIPSTIGGVESLIKIFVGSNNELTSQYSVRGGNYDENLIYVNDFEVFRPYLTRSGQQEGLSFINAKAFRRVGLCEFAGTGFSCGGNRPKREIHLCCRST